LSENKIISFTIIISTIIIPTGYITTINITIYRINSTSTTVVETGNMAFLQKGVWYYEFDADANENGNYMGVTNIQTNEVPPNYPSCSALFTISGRGVFKIIGISPDLVDVNETVRLATEITLNGELVSASRLVNPQLWVVQVNGSTQYYNETNGLGKAPGLVYLDGQFNQTGVYYLNWSVEYYNRTKNVQEIVVAKDWDVSFGNITIGNQSLDEIRDLIIDNKNKLVEMLREMEKQQEFSAEEIFLVTDAVNSMTRVANMLAEGEITEDEARQEVDRINSNLETRMGGKITGRLTNIFGSPDEDQSSALWSLAILMAIVIIIAMAVKGKARQKAGVNEYRSDGRPRRRYQVLISKFARMVMRLQSRSRHRQFEPKKDVPLAMFFKRRPAAERQQTLYESLSSGINRIGGRVKMKIKHSNFAPRRKRRYEMMIGKITNKVREARRIRQQKADKIREERIRRELTARKAKPGEIFRPRPEKQPRYKALANEMKKRMHEAMLRRKAAKEMHKKRVRQGGHTQTRVNAKELFAAIDKYKTEEGVYSGMMRDEPVERIAEEYDACAARTAVFEESRAVTGLRNAFAAIRDTIPSERIKSAASKIP